MSDSCQVCQEILSKKSPGVQCGSCELFYHANSLCCDVNKQHLSLIDSLPGGRWLCAQCRVASPPPRRGTRARSAKTAAGPVSRPVADMNPELDLIRQEIREMKGSVDFCSNKISDFEGMLHGMSNLIKITEGLKSENAQLRERISSMNQRLNAVEQHSRSNSVEIQDIPEKSGENLLQIIDTIGTSLGHSIARSDIDYVTRVPTKLPSKPKHIVVRFVSKLNRDAFLAKAKTKCQENENRGLEIEGLSNKFYINEHLTTMNKILHKATREAAKQHRYKFVWIKNGNILVRKSDTSRIMNISSEADISKMK